VAKETTILAKVEDKAAGSTKPLGERMKDLSGKLKDAGVNIRSVTAGVAKAAAGIAVRVNRRDSSAASSSPSGSGQVRPARLARARRSTMVVYGRPMARLSWRRLIGSA